MSNRIDEMPWDTTENVVWTWRDVFKLATSAQFSPEVRQLALNELENLAVYLDDQLHGGFDRLNIDPWHAGQVREYEAR